MLIHILDYKVEPEKNYVGKYVNQLKGDQLVWYNSDCYMQEHFAGNLG